MANPLLDSILGEVASGLAAPPRAPARPVSPLAAGPAAPPAMPVWQQRALNEINHLPHLSKAGQTVILDRHRQAFEQLTGQQTIPTPAQVAQPSGAARQAGISVAQGMIDPAIGLTSLVAPATGNALRDASQRFGEANAVDPTATLNIGARAIGNAIPMLGTGAAGSVVGGTTMAGSLAAGGFGFASGAGAARGEVLDARQAGTPVSAGQELGFAGASGLAEAIPEALSFGVASGLGRMVTAPLAGRLAGTVLTNVGEESTTQVLQNAAAAGFGVDPGRPVTEGLREAAIGGAFAGGAMAPLTVAAHQAETRRRQGQRAAQVIANATGRQIPEGGVIIAERPKGSTGAAVKYLAGATDYDVAFFASDDPTARGAQGFIDDETRTIFVNRDRPDAIIPAVLTHEAIGHRAGAASSEVRQAMQEFFDGRPDLQRLAEDAYTAEAGDFFATPLSAERTAEEGRARALEQMATSPEFLEWAAANRPGVVVGLARRADRLLSRLGAEGPKRRLVARQIKTLEQLQRYADTAEQNLLATRMRQERPGALASERQVDALDAELSDLSAREQIAQEERALDERERAGYPTPPEVTNGYQISPETENSRPLVTTPDPRFPMPLEEVADEMDVAAEAAERFDREGYVPPAAVTPSDGTGNVQRPEGFGRGELEEWIGRHYDETEGEADAEVGFQQDAALEEGSVGVGGAFTFTRNPKTKTGYPQEVERFFESPEGRKARRAGMFRLVEPGVSGAGGEDAMQNLGEDAYFAEAVRRVEDTGAGRLRRAVDFAHRSPNPLARFNAALFDEMPPARVRDRATGKMVRNPDAPDMTLMDRDDFRIGARWTTNGRGMEAVEGPDGDVVVRTTEADEFPETPLEALERVPVDRGSFRQGGGATSEPDTLLRDPGDDVAPFSVNRDDRRPVTADAGQGRTPPQANAPKRPRGTDHSLARRDTATLSEDDLYRAGYLIHSNLRATSDAEQDAARESILANGFRRAMNVNAMPLTHPRAMTNIIQRKFEPRPGKDVYLIPEEGVEDGPNGARVKEGWKPRPDQIVRLRDGETLYQAIQRQARERQSFEQPDGVPFSVNNRDLYGRETFDRATGGQAGPLFHEPNAAPPPRDAAADRVDARIARQYDPAATPSMFPEKGDAPFKETLFSVAAPPDSPEFRRWFGASKVVDKDGKPLVVYHGTDKRFNAFDPGKTVDGTFWFTSDRATLDRGESGAAGRGRVMPLYASLKNPAGWDEYDRLSLQELRERGYDGAILPNDDGTFDGFAFEPTQLKSVDNTGTFDPANPDVRFSVKAPPPTIGSQFALSNESMWDAVRRKVQDEFLPLKRMQADVARQGGTVTDPSDVYLKTELFQGRVADQAKKIRTDFAQPIVDRMTKAGIELPDLDEYVYALHAPERNATIAQRDPSIPDGGSGMTNAEAAAIVAKVKASGKQADYDAIADLVHRLNRQTLRTSLDAGLITQQTYTELTGRWQFYVPLRTDMEADGANLRQGQGFTVRGKEFRAATGRGDRADSPLTFSLMQAQEKIVRAEKNRVGQALLRFVRDNPDPDLWAVDNAPTVRTLTPLGTVGQRPDPRFQFADNVVAVKEGGEARLIEFKGEAGMKVARAFKRLGTTDAGALVRLLQFPMRVYRNLQTNLNPDFILPNLIRDVQAAAINLSASDGAKMAARVVKNVPRAMKAVWDTTGRDPNAKRGSVYHDAMREYLAAGGKVDSYALSDFAATQKQLADLLADANPSPRRRVILAVRKAGEFVDRLNGAVETASRLSAFVEARRAGMTAERAASLAKNLTVNFNRKGEAGTAINTLYLFANASIQGNARMLKALGTTRKGRAIAGGILASGVAYGLLAPMLFGDDDEGRDRWEQIPEWEKSTHLIIPGPDGGHLKVPMPYGYAAIFSAGRLFAEAVTGRKGPGAAAVGVVTEAANAFNPLGGEGSLVQTLSPTILDPVVQAAENKDWKGDAIVPAQPNPFGPPVPDSQLSMRSTSPYTKAVAEWVNRVTGGDEVTAGRVDVSPATLDHFVGWATGGTGRFVERAAELPARVAAGDVPMNSVPIARRFADSGQTDAQLDRRAFYDVARQAEDATADLRHYETTGQSAKADTLRRSRARELDFAHYAREVRSTVSELRKAGDEAGAATVLDEFMKRYRDDSLPQRWRFENELRTLERRERDAKEKGERLPPRDRARLKKLRVIGGKVDRMEKLVAEGRMPRERGEAHVNRLAALARPA